jgi:hypothetical protein
VFQRYLGALGELGLAGSKGSRQTVLGIDTVNTVNSVQVLDKSDLEACSGTLARRNCGVSKEVLPDLQMISAHVWTVQCGKLTRYQRLPYLAVTLSLFASQLRYHLQSVAE